MKSLLESAPHSFCMWLASWFRCPLCRQWTLKYVRSHGGVICTSNECEERARTTAKLLAETLAAQNQP
jgi:hypothetical protein